MSILWQNYYCLVPGKAWRVCKIILFSNRAPVLDYTSSIGQNGSLQIMRAHLILSFLFLYMILLVSFSLFIRITIIIHSWYLKLWISSLLTGPDAVKFIIGHSDMACVFCTPDKLEIVSSSNLLFLLAWLRIYLTQ